MKGLVIPYAPKAEAKQGYFHRRKPEKIKKRGPDDTRAGSGPITTSQLAYIPKLLLSNRIRHLQYPDR